MYTGSIPVLASNPLFSQTTGKFSGVARFDLEIPCAFGLTSRAIRTNPAKRMKLAAKKPRPKKLKLHDKRQIRMQVGALCLRPNNGKTEVLLVTTRTTRRWTIPRGWPMNGKTPAQSAAEEAWEEGGARGNIGNDSVGVYTYHKEIAGRVELRAVSVYPLEVTEVADKYPESNQRKHRWFPLKKAAKRVREPELARIFLKVAQMRG